MPKVTVASLVDVVTTRRLLPPAQLDELTSSLAPHATDARQLAQDLVARGWLTAFQAQQLASSRGRELVLGPYLLLDRAGVGSMGDVFEARHRETSRIVALKVIHKEHLGNPDLVRRFRNEIQAATRLTHPNIIQAIDSAQVGDTLYLAMEYVRGIDLHRLLLRNGPLPVGQACRFIRQAALGLQHAHEQGLVHRDIKPANLMVTENDETVKVLDLGFAQLRHADGRPVSGVTKQGAILGTTDYLPPEQALNARNVDIRSDIYSLGCTLYHLLAGRPPFVEGNAIEKAFRHQHDDPEPIEQLRPDVPTAVGDVIRRMMAKKPDDRYQTPAEVAEALADVPQTRGREAKALSNKIRALPRPTRLDKPTRWRILIGVGIAIAVIVAAMAVWWFR